MSEESDSESDREDREGTWGVDTVEDRGECVPHISVCVQVDGKEVTMELDTRASLSLMSENVYHKLWPGRSLDSTTVRLQTYACESLELVSSATVQVGYESQTVHVLPLIVVKGDGATLLGRNWLHKIKLNWRKIQQVHKPRHSLLEQYSEVFRKA